MQPIIKEDLIKTLEQAKHALKQNSEEELNDISQSSVHLATIYQNHDAINLAVVLYSWSKLIKRHQFDPKTYLPVVEALLNALKQNDHKNFDKVMESAMQHTKELDQTAPKYVCKVMNQARVKQSAELHNQGISLAQSAEQCGISLWELYNYIGKTTMNDNQKHSMANMRKRLAFARSLFN